VHPRGLTPDGLRNDVAWRDRGADFEQITGFARRHPEAEVGGVMIPIVMAEFEDVGRTNGAAVAPCDIVAEAVRREAPWMHAVPRRFTCTRVRSWAKDLYAGTGPDLGRLRPFLGLPLSKNPPDHSTISRTRRLLDLETHRKIFTWVLGVLAKANLLRGKILGVDATTLEANAALRSIVRRDNGQHHNEFLTDIARAAGIEDPTREDLARLDRKRPKKSSNEDWVHPLDSEAEIMKMKDGRTHLAHKQEHAVDLETGAIVGVTLAGGAAGDTSSCHRSPSHSRRAKSSPRVWTVASRISGSGRIVTRARW
jgi:hypothetical protein